MYVSPITLTIEQKGLNKQDHLKGVDEYLKSRRMSCQFEQSHDPDDAEELENFVFFA